MNEPEFGALGTITTRLKRRGTVYCFWEEVSVKKPTAAIFLGWRTLSNGRTNLDEGYSPTKHFRAALVCTNGKTNPFYVPEYQVQNFE